MPQPGRTIAIGDIHGCSHALDALLAAIEPRPSDTIITLGDTIDRGPDSQGVIDRLMDLDARCRLVPILGNHEQMLFDVLAGLLSPVFWLACGGEAVLKSYGVQAPADLPDDHLNFLRGGLNFVETETHLFAHACYDPDLPMAEQAVDQLRWTSLRNQIPGPHASGKVVILGHTAQKSGEILDLGHLLCIDTYCYGGQWLTAIEIGSSQIWQTNQKGETRLFPDR